jgi:hypothetical protein
MCALFIMVRWIGLALAGFIGLTGLAKAHSGIVDGYGCHRGSDKANYHCH